MGADSDDKTGGNNGEETQDDRYRPGPGGSAGFHGLIDEFITATLDNLKIGGRCFRCSTAPAEIQRKKSKVLRLDKNLVFAPRLPQGAVEALSRGWSRDMPGRQSDKGTGLLWDGGPGLAPLREESKLTPSPREKAVPGPRRRAIWLYIKEQSHRGKKNGSYSRLVSGT